MSIIFALLSGLGFVSALLGAGYLVTAELEYRTELKRLLKQCLDKIERLENRANKGDLS